MASPDLLSAALDYASKGWAVFPCKWQGENAKAPITWNGFKDATTDSDQIRAWWTRYPNAMIGAPMPAKLVVIDIDPRNGGDIVALEKLTGPLPATLTAWSGRGDGGRHLYFIRPVGVLTATNLPDGIDLKASGYCIVPPSIHPASGEPYRWEAHPPAPAPLALKQLLRKMEPPRQSNGQRRNSIHSGRSVADEYCATHTWADVLEQHDWRCKSADGDRDGAIWLHPTHTSGCSATVRYGLLFVWSSNTPFPQSEPGNPSGLTKFRAYSILEHGGNMSTAAAELARAAVS